MRIGAAGLFGAFLLAAATAAPAQEIKVGINLPYTGVAAEIAQQMDRGLELYLKQHAAELKPLTIRLIKRDVKDPAGANARLAVQELLTQENVDIMGGWLYSPNAIATAPIVTAGKKLAVIMNAGTAHIPSLSPNYVRFSFSAWHAAFTLGQAAMKTLNAKTAVIGYTDFPTGKDSRDAFKAAFEAAGGKVLDDIPMGGPGAVPDFTPFFQRAKDAKPDVFFIFVPSGDHATAVARTYAALGMRQAGIRLIGSGDLTVDNKLQSMGQAAVGMVTMHHYTADLDTPANKAFVEAWKKEYGPDSTPDFTGVGGYDGMAGIVHVVKELKGKIDTEKALGLLKGWKHASPRGPISIDPETRDVVMNEYLSEVVADDKGRLRMKLLATFEGVKDPCKAQKIGPCAKW